MTVALYVEGDAFMFIYGYAKDYKYTGDGTLLVKVRIPNVHGPYLQANNKSKRSYVLDDNLPYYPSILLPHLPNDGDIVLLSSTNNTMNDLVVLGLTGGSFLNSNTELT